jgi:hypothetical protein
MSDEEWIAAARARWQRLRARPFVSTDMQHLIQVDLPRLWRVIDRLRAAATPPASEPNRPGGDSNVDEPS